MAGENRQRATWAGESRPSVYERRESSTMRSIARWHPVAVAFSDGFVGGMTGGALYRLLIAYFYPAGWTCSWMQVLALAMILGSFESWRVVQGRPRPRSTNGHLMGLLFASLLLWWAISAVAGSQKAFTQPKPSPQRQRVTRAQNDQIRSPDRPQPVEVEPCALESPIFPRKSDMATGMPVTGDPVAAFRS